MEFTYAISRVMHEEHMAVLGLLEKIEQLLNSNLGTEAPEATTGDTRLLLGTMKAEINTEIKLHFAFEEEHLFPLFEEAGAGDMNSILINEHRVLMPLGLRLAEMAGQAGSDGFTDDSWAEFKMSAGQFIDGLRSHVAKEEMGMVPMLDDLIDEDKDAELMNIYKFS
ncbi:MAG: hemerythrin domain-containing protein [Rhizobiales bacterium]|nr:hemerythrin domain-containing protein [Hyphomicrobiales bacterium]